MVKIKFDGSIHVFETFIDMKNFIASHPGAEIIAPEGRKPDPRYKKRPEGEVVYLTYWSFKGQTCVGFLKTDGTKWISPKKCVDTVSALRWIAGEIVKKASARGEKVQFSCYMANCIKDIAYSAYPKNAQAPDILAFNAEVRAAVEK